MLLRRSSQFFTSGPPAAVARSASSSHLLSPSDRRNSYKPATPHSCWVSPRLARPHAPRSPPSRAPPRWSNMSSSLHQAPHHSVDDERGFRRGGAWWWRGGWRRGGVLLTPPPAADANNNHCLWSILLVLAGASSIIGYSCSHRQHPSMPPHCALTSRRGGPPAGCAGAAAGGGGAAGSVLRTEVMFSDHCVSRCFRSCHCCFPKMRWVDRVTTTTRLTWSSFASRSFAPMARTTHCSTSSLSHCGGRRWGKRVTP